MPHPADMEETLRKLQKEATGNKHRAIKDNCASAIDVLEAPEGVSKVPPCQLRVCEYISTLEHTHFSEGASQLSLTITQSQSTDSQGLSADFPQEQTKGQEASLGKSPIIQPIPIQELIKEGNKGRAFDFRANTLMSASNAAKAVCTLSTQADKLFEGAADKLNLVALSGFLYQLKKASQAQLFHSVTDTVDYSLAMPGKAFTVLRR